MSRRRVLTDQERIAHRQAAVRKYIATLPERSFERPYIRGISFDRSRKSVRDKRHECWRAEVWVGGRRMRKRFRNYDDAAIWLESMRGTVAK